ncbi:recombinase family protein [Croceitalea marina]|uniref:Recombinase family protein n=1 Tax=Croceitalea marina TaxID=1775166 RepID=A0ABW5N197_9FLAO
MMFGYARVSTQEQNLEAQIDLLKKSGCEKIYTDVASGVRSNRKGLNELIKYMRQG